MGTVRRQKNIDFINRSNPLVQGGQGWGMEPR